MKEKIRYAFYLLLPIIGGSIIGFLIKDYIDYKELIKPPLSPPSIFFPIAWTIIYILLGISYFIYRKNNYNKKTIRIYYIQLFFNFLWSIIFFIFKLRFISIIWILILDILLILLMKSFYKEQKISTYLLIPYILWIIFATYLNIGIYLLN